MRRRKIGATAHTLTYDAENRLTRMSGGASATFVYDGDGGWVKAAFGSSTTVYIGDHYEQTGSTICKHYYAGGQRVAVRAGGTLTYLHGDHLGSATLATDLNGNRVGELRYTPYGVTRYEWGVMPTDRRFTGQLEERGLGSLYDYGARRYSPALGRFLQPDPIVPEPGNPQSLNRYAYVLNNPLRYTDPSGHWIETAWDIANILWDIYEVQRDPSLVNIGALVVDVGAAVLPIVPAGAGMVVRGGKVAKAAIKVATHADEVVDVAKVGTKVAEEVAEEAAERVGKEVAEATTQRLVRHHIAT